MSYTAAEVAEVMSDMLGDWNENASVSADGKKVTLTAGVYRECKDDPYAYLYEFEIGGEFYCTPQGGYGRNWGTPYNAGLDTLEKVRYACECAESHNWRNWG